MKYSCADILTSWQVGRSNGLLAHDQQAFSLSLVSIAVRTPSEPTHTPHTHLTQPSTIDLFLPSLHQSSLCTRHTTHSTQHTIQTAVDTMESAPGRVSPKPTDFMDDEMRLEQPDTTELGNMTELTEATTTAPVEEAAITPEEVARLSDSRRAIRLQRQLDNLTRCLRHIEARLENTVHLSEELEALKHHGSDIHSEKEEDDDSVDAAVATIPHTSFRERSNHVSLAEDTFSFIISAHPRSLPFACGVFVSGLKTLIFLLVLVNLINFDVQFNKLGVPVSVNTTVVISQFIAFAISVFTQNDLLTSLIQFFQGHNSSLRNAFHREGAGGGYRAQWWFAVIALALNGKCPQERKTERQS